MKTVLGLFAAATILAMTTPASAQIALDVRSGAEGLVWKTMSCGGSSIAPAFDIVTPPRHGTIVVRAMRPNPRWRCPNGEAPGTARGAFYTSRAGFVGTDGFTVHVLAATIRARPQQSVRINVTR